jgi:hypothetical protein
VHEGSVHPRLQLGASVRPLNFTVSRQQDSLPRFAPSFDLAPIA